MARSRLFGLSCPERLRDRFRDRIRLVQPCIPLRDGPKNAHHVNILVILLVKVLQGGLPGQCQQGRPVYVCICYSRGEVCRVLSQRRVPDFSSLRSRLVSTRNLIMAQNPHPRAIDMSSPNFEQLHSKNIDDLYEVLGRSLVSPEYPGAAVVTKQVATQRGRAFVSGSLDKLRTKICVDWHYCDKRTQ